jgi:hypothetical protein
VTATAPLKSDLLGTGFLRVGAQSGKASLVGRLRVVPSPVPVQSERREPEKGGKWLMKKDVKEGRSTVIFRRFRRIRGGKILDAWDYGHKAWPIRLRRS